MKNLSNNLFSINGPALLRPFLEQITGLKALSKRHQQMPPVQGLFFQAVLDELNIQFEVSDNDRAKIPQTGSVMLVANHPFGAVDGMILAVLAKQVRPDAKVLANQMLAAFDPEHEVGIYVDVFNGESAIKSNLKGMRQSTELLKDEGCLSVFPAGEVATWAPTKAAVTEADWHPHFAKMARKTGATVVPVYFAGRNSLTFQLVSQLHRYLKLAMLPKEMLKKQNVKIQLRIGNPISPKKFERYPTDPELVRYFRQRTLLLGQRNQSEDQAVKAIQRHHQAVLQPATSPEMLAAEIDNLPAECLLIDNGEFQVYCADAKDLEEVLPEIGRLRELSFRAVGEGTGKQLDLDLYDEYYKHLFLWHKNRQEIVGAYRLGESVKIFQQFHKKGFYSYSLFKFSSEFFRQISPALEMGRSFINPNYQKGFAPLMLLWKGIAAFISQHPEIQVLFGPVSISAEYTELSKELMTLHLTKQTTMETLSKLVKPRRPFKSRLSEQLGFSEGQAAQDLGQLAETIEELEGGQRSVPVLLKQYLKLGGAVLQFNVDADFSNCLDGLIVVDLLKTDRRNLEKYLGKQEAQRYLEFHQSSIAG